MGAEQGPPGAVVPGYWTSLAVLVGPFDQEARWRNIIEREEIAQLWGQSDEVLLKAIGTDVHGAFPQDALERGAKVLDRLRAAAQDAICTSPRIRALVQNADRLALSMAVAELLASRFGVDAAGPVAVLIVRAGVTEYCRLHWVDTPAT